MNEPATAEIRISGDPPEWRHTGKSPGLIERLVFNREGDERPRLFAGPWIGEFGWEVARWQGGIRKIARNLAGSHRVIVVSDPGHAPLYEYADEFWCAPSLLGRFTRQCDHIRGTVEEARALRDLLGEVAALLAPWRDEDKAIVPRRFRPEHRTPRLLTASDDAREMVKRLVGGHAFFCIMPRNRAWTPAKNWHSEKWEELIYRVQASLGLMPLILGTREEAASFLGVPSVALDISLDQGIAALRSAEFAVCSEGGGIFLSLHCGAPTVAFGHVRWRRRVCEEENPLRAPVVYVGRPDNKHTVEEVLDGVHELLRQ